MTHYQYAPGDQPLDGYTIQYALGRGGFGEVYFAMSDAGREVALKVVQNHEDVELRGIRHCMNLKSSHLVMIFDIKVGADGTPWVIMEYIAGPSLREILDDHPEGLGDAKSAFLVRELAKGLSDLHESGVVHRDLKPHNVFFENGTVKVGDYSLSKAMTASHRSGHTMTIGSVHYMAPEISMGRYDKTVDLYALGVILFEMLTGRPPYEGESMGEVLMKHLNSEPDLSGLDEPYASVIAKAMQRDPQDRYQSAREMAAALLDHDSVEQLADTITPQSFSQVGISPRRQRHQQGERLVGSSSELAVLRRGQKVEASSHRRADSPPLAWMQSWFQVEGHWGGRTVMVVLAFAVTWLLLLIGVFSGWVQVAPSLCPAIAAFITVAVVVSRWFFRLVPICRSDSRFADRWFTALVRRAFSLVPLFGVFLVLFNTLDGTEKLRLESGFSALVVSFIVIDWIRLISPGRAQWVAAIPTIAVGVIASVVSVIAVGDADWMVFDAALVMSTALALQMVSPVLMSSRATGAIGEGIDH